MISHQRRSKLMSRWDGSFQILERINDNAYKVDILGEYVVNAIFNDSNLPLVDVDDDYWMNYFEERRDDMVKTTPNDSLEVSIRPITRSRAKKLKDTINGLI